MVNHLEKQIGQIVKFVGFMQAKKEENDKDILETFRKVQVNIPLLDAIKQEHLDQLHEDALETVLTNGIELTNHMASPIAPHDTNLEFHAMPFDDEKIIHSYSLIHTICHLSSCPPTFTTAFILSSTIPILPYLHPNTHTPFPNLCRIPYQSKFILNPEIHPKSPKNSSLAVLENIVFDEHTREVDYSDKSATENTRAAYPIEYIPNAKIPCIGPHPNNVKLLACDAFGVLPPVSKLNLAQTLYHFISGYTALVAGTEDGIKEPTATFSACFGAAFIMLHPTKYAAMLAEKMQKHSATGWLVNTGWSGGSYGSGKRIKLPYTRKIIDAIHSGSLLNAKYKKTEVFGLEIPTEVEGVPSEILDPVNT
ncbi:phosphoenolpyruvate carboxykinase (ATP) 1-like [Pyrus x bretschneideri]|uniref:phosphoenolpyruvate carboxykinase (ATP) 1-like n=1 Tax=Pyrus x bretschneideri TaxID=225117 RepID=UPI00203027D5|nr:phosphoenolpyruvate carboxykinase (ATP) 1-like [Pyrus x bretschneideri]